jgi:hypothetical protein
METFQIDILNPKVKKLLKDLADLNLIKIRRSNISDFSKLISRFRSKSTESLSLEDITKEVEDVRKSRNEK